jgi:hypothetical protein
MPRSRFPRARLPSSETHAAAASGAVSAGSNPVGGTGQRHNSNTLLILTSVVQSCDLRKRRHVLALRPPDRCSSACAPPHAGCRTVPQTNTGRRIVHARNPSRMFTVTLARTVAGPDLPAQELVSRHRRLQPNGRTARDIRLRSARLGDQGQVARYRCRRGCSARVVARRPCRR